MEDWPSLEEPWDADVYLSALPGKLGCDRAIDSLENILGCSGPTGPVPSVAASRAALLTWRRPTLAGSGRLPLVPKPWSERTFTLLCESPPTL